MLEGAKVPGAVLDERPSRRQPRVVAFQLGRILALHVGSVECVVAQEEEGGALELVGTALGDDVDDTPRAAAELGPVAGVEDLELLDGVLGVGLEDPAPEVVVVLEAVDEEGGVARPLTQDAASCVAVGDVGAGVVVDQRQAQLMRERGQYARGFVEQLSHVARRVRQGPFQLGDHRAIERRRREQGAHIEPPAARGRHPTRRAVGALQQSQPFQLRQLGSYAG